MKAAILLFPGVTAFEALGPFGVFRRVPGGSARLVAAEAGRVPTQGSKVALLADATYEDVPHPDVVVVPGGLGIRRLVDDEAARAWVAEAHTTTTWTTSVSTGSVLLAAAGVLDGDATTHWLATELLEEQGAHAVAEAIVRSGRVMTAKGSVAAIEMALEVVRRQCGADVAGRIRRELDVEALGPMDPGKPTPTETLVALAGPDELSEAPAYVLGPGKAPMRRKASTGRIELLAAPI